MDRCLVFRSALGVPLSDPASYCLGGEVSRLLSHRLPRSIFVRSLAGPSCLLATHLCIGLTQSVRKVRLGRVGDFNEFADRSARLTGFYQLP